MAIKIRLRQQGRHRRAFYRLVVTDVRAPRDGKYIDCLGWYDPFGSTPETNLSINSEKVTHWLNQGAQISENALSLVQRGARSAFDSYIEKQRVASVKASAKRRALKKKA